MKDKDDKKVKVVPEFTIRSGNGADYAIKGFDEVWHFAQGLTIPISVSFKGFTRIKDDKKKS